jgi:YegS/Rv2252/BmrU family lipid kinase
MDTEEKMLNIVYNPTAAKGKARNKLKIIEEKLQKLNIIYKINESLREKHAIELTKQLIADGATDIIAMGGDGTINEVLNGFSNFENVNLGIIPSGSGNDFVTSIGIPLDPDKALDIIINEKPKYTDFMQLEGVRGINVVGTGIDVDVLKRVKRGKLFRGKLQYLVALISSLFKFKDYNLDITYNDKTEKRKGLLACVCNGRMFGGGIKICPIAVPDDGYLDYMVAFNVRKKKIMGAFKSLMKGTILKEPITHTEKTTEIEVTSPEKMTINVDGELYENLPFKVKLVHEKLKIYRP